MEEDDATHYSVEFLNSLNTLFVLTVGVPIILLRNLCSPTLCNATRPKISSLQQNVIEPEILTSCGAADIVFIQIIPLIPNNFTFSFKRVQVPVSLCYAMTINKPQGQTLSVAGVDLSTNCFSHHWSNIYTSFASK